MNQEVIIVRGNHTLKGDVRVSGAKNSALKLSLIHILVGTLDTNCDPDDVDYGIPANDDAIRSVRLLADFMADAVIAGTGADVTAAEMAGEAAAADAVAEVAVEAAADVAEGAGAEVVADVVADAE